MARTPSMTTGEAEAQLGTRGNLNLRSMPDLRRIVKMWLTAQGYNAAFVAGLSSIELQNAYNGAAGLEAVNKKWTKAKAGTPDLDFDPPLPGDMGTPAVPQPPRPHVDGGAQENAPAPFPVAVNPLPAPAGQDPAQMLRDLILGGWTPPASVDEAKVRQIVQEQLTGIAPRVIHVQHPDKPVIKIEGLVHPEFPRALKYLNQGMNVMLVGPAGSGKSTMGKMLAKALDVTYGFISGSSGASESEFKGWLLPADGGKFEYAPSQFVTLYERGNALWNFDEMDGFDPNLALTFNVPLDNGHMAVQQRRENPLVTRGPNFFFMGTANTYGTGGNTVYAGRNPLDEATRDRFVFITVDYDKRLEEAIGAAGGLTAAEMASIWEMRDRCREAGLKRTISTRAFQKAGGMKQTGDSWREIRDRLVEGWSKDEKAKVGA